MRAVTGELAGRIALIALVVVVAAVVGTVGVWGAIASDAANAANVEVADAISQVLFGTAFVLGGLVAWWSRPDNNTGRLMAGTGLLFAAGSWQTVDDGWLLIAGALASLAAVATFLHLILAFPAGRIEHAPDRWVVGVAYAVVAGVALTVPFVQPNQADCEGCADNPLAVAPNDTATTIVVGLANVAIGLCVIALLVISWRRFRRATPALRRTMVPLVGTASLAGVLFLLSIPLSLTSGWVRLAFGICFVTVMTLVPVAFLIGLLRDRLQRTSSIQGLVIRLAGATDHEHLRSILAEALRDPGLTIAFWFPERQTYVDPSGHPIEVPEQGVTVVERDGEPIARLIHDPALDEDPALLETVAAAAAIGLERARLEAELRARLDELRASRARIVETAYHARRRLERDLHDGAQQRLVALSLTLRMISNRLRDDESTAALVEGASTELAAALAELRELARGIHPAILTDRGLEPALAALADRAPVPVDLDVQEDLAVPPAHEAALYFVASEALANVAKYAGGTGASVHVWREADGVAIEISDDGKGGADPEQGSGLSGLRDRVEAMDGRFAVSSPPGAGTRVRATLPVAPPAPAHAEEPAPSASA